MSGATSGYGVRFLQNAVLVLLLFSCMQKAKDEVPPVEKTSTEQQSRAEVASPGIQNNCSYANETSTLGIGLILAPAQFTLFDDSLLTHKFADIDMYNDQEALTQLCPKFFKPDYGIMHFVCVDSTETIYKVLTDSSSFKFMGNVSSAEFTTWENYILNSFGIRRLTDSDGDPALQNDLKMLPSQESKALAIPEGFEMFCPMEMRGSWVKVRYDCFYNRDDNPHEGEPCHNFIQDCKDPLTGWVKWKDESKILIDIFLMP